MSDSEEGEDEDSEAEDEGEEVSLFNLWVLALIVVIEFFSV